MMILFTELAVEFADPHRHILRDGHVRCGVMTPKRSAG